MVSKTVKGNKLCNEGLKFAHKREFGKARVKFLEAIATEPNNEYFLYYIGQCWQEDNDFYRAIDFYTKALKINPSLPEVLNNVAKLYYDHEGDYKGAISFLEKAIEESKEPLAKNMIILYQNLAKLYKQQLNTEKSDYYLRKWYECQGIEMLFDITHGIAELGDDDDDEEEENEEEEGDES